MRRRVGPSFLLLAVTLLPHGLAACTDVGLNRRGVPDSVVLAHIRDAYEDARAAYGNPPEREITLLSWPQTWPNTALGFERPGLQAITRAQTVVVIYRNRARIYHGGHLAYETHAKDPRLTRGIEARKLPGKIEWQRDH